jgi:hypothetical protein
VKYFSGRATAQAVNRQLLTAEAWVRNQVKPSGFCDEQTGTRTGFPPSTSGLPLSVTFHRSSIFTHISSGGRTKAHHRPSSTETLWWCVFTSHAGWTRDHYILTLQQSWHMDKGFNRVLYGHKSESHYHYPVAYTNVKQIIKLFLKTVFHKKNNNLSVFPCVRTTI